MNPFRAISLQQFDWGGDRAKNLHSKWGETGIVSNGFKWRSAEDLLIFVAIHCVDRISSEMWVQSVHGARANFKLQAGP